MGVSGFLRSACTDAVKGCALGWGGACLNHGEELMPDEGLPFFKKACPLGIDQVCNDLETMK